MTHLRSQLRVMGQSAPDPPARTATNRASQALETLKAAIDTDRALRIGPPPPTSEQLGYSEALLRQRAAELERPPRTSRWPPPPAEPGRLTRLHGHPIGKSPRASTAFSPS